MGDRSIKLKFHAYALFSGWEPTADEEAAISELLEPMLKERGIEVVSLIWISQTKFVAMGILDGLAQSAVRTELDGAEVTGG